jgi:hypothetical protein
MINLSDPIADTKQSIMDHCEYRGFKTAKENVNKKVMKDNEEPKEKDESEIPAEGSPNQELSLEQYQHIIVMWGATKGKWDKIDKADKLTS